jgi:hypothetical protein
MSTICLDITTTLFHSLWQSGVLYLAYFICTIFKNNKSPEWNRKFAISILISQFFISLFTFFLVHQKDNSFALPLLDSLVHFNSITTPSNSIYIISAYSFIFFVKQSSSYFRRIVFTKQLVQEMILPTDEFISLVRKHNTTLRFRGQIRFFFHNKINSALTIGFWKPIVIFPIALVNQLSTAETEALILHELHHIKNCDFLFLRLATLIQNLFFFNPFIYLIKKNTEADMELSCDHAVLLKQKDMISYAVALQKTAAFALHKSQMETINAIGTKGKILYRLNQFPWLMKTKYHSNYPIATLALPACILFFMSFFGNPEPAVEKANPNVFAYEKAKVKKGSNLLIPAKNNRFVKSNESQYKEMANIDATQIQKQFDVFQNPTSTPSLLTSFEAENNSKQLTIEEETSGTGVRTTSSFLVLDENGIMQNTWLWSVEETIETTDSIYIDTLVQFHEYVEDLR